MCLHFSTWINQPAAASQRSGALFLRTMKLHVVLHARNETAGNSWLQFNIVLRRDEDNVACTKYHSKSESRH